MRFDAGQVVDSRVVELRFRAWLSSIATQRIMRRKVGQHLHFGEKDTVMMKLKNKAPTHMFPSCGDPRARLSRCQYSL